MPDSIKQVTFVFQYYYSVRVLPGQEPFNVWVGWVTSNFHRHDATFDADRVHTVTVTLGDDSGKVQERWVGNANSLSLPHEQSFCPCPLLHLTACFLLFV